VILVVSIPVDLGILSAVLQGCSNCVDIPSSSTPVHGTCDSLSELEASKFPTLKGSRLGTWARPYLNVIPSKYLGRY
jgi:hypothetical protein